MKAPIRTTSLVLALLAPIAVSAPSPGPTPTLAQEDDAGSGAGEPEVFIEARADRVLWSMGQFLGSAKGFRVHIESLEDEPHPSGQWVQVASRADLAVHREVGIRSSKRGDLEAVEFWTNLQIAAMLDPETNLYALVEVPSTLDAAIDHLIDEYGISWPLADIAYSDPYIGLIESVDVGTYVGLHEVAGVDCHHLAFRSGLVDWQIWIEAGVAPLPRKVVINYNGLEGTPRYMATLSRWEIEPHLPASLFQFDAPEGAEQIEVESIREE